jgi:hypothetical protein
MRPAIMSALCSAKTAIVDPDEQPHMPGELKL